METKLVCPTCFRAPAAPFRVWDASGKILSGCVDACHTGHLVTPSASASWHARPAARQIRKGLARFVTPGVLVEARS